MANNGEMPSSSKTPIQNKKVSETAKNKRPQKKRGLENQDLCQPKSKIVNKPVYTEEATDEDSDQQEKIQTITQNAMPVQKEAIESNPRNQSQNEDEETNEDQINEPPKIPVKGTAKWEKKASERRASEGTTKKRDRWGNNVMITKVEKVSNDEENESLPSVFEIRPRQEEETSKRKTTFKKLC